MVGHPKPLLWSPLGAPSCSQTTGCCVPCVKAKLAANRPVKKTAESCALSHLLAGHQTLPTLPLIILLPAKPLLHYCPNLIIGECEAKVILSELAVRRVSILLRMVAL